MPCPICAAELAQRTPDYRARALKAETALDAMRAERDTAQERFRCEMVTRLAAERERNAVRHDFADLKQHREAAEDGLAEALRERDDALATTTTDAQYDILRSDYAALQAKHDALIATHKGLEKALRAILADPYGCRFCDSGKLRTPADPKYRHMLEACTEHDDSCGYGLAKTALLALASHGGDATPPEKAT